VALLLAALAVTALVTGLGSASGLLRSVGGFRGIWLHVAAAIALVPLVVWHVRSPPARRPARRLTSMDAAPRLGVGADVGAARQVAGPMAHRIHPPGGLVV
jgi:hypothetical protein